MAHARVNRRTLLKGATALGALAATSGRLLAQQADRPPVRTAAGPAAPLPQRGELLVRGATVLTLDPTLGDGLRKRPALLLNAAHFYSNVISAMPAPAVTLKACLQHYAGGGDPRNSPRAVGLVTWMQASAGMTSGCLLWVSEIMHVGIICPVVLGPGQDCLAPAYPSMVRATPTGGRVIALLSDGRSSSCLRRGQDAPRLLLSARRGEMQK